MSELERIYFIGREEQLRGFVALGVRVLGVESLSAAEDALRKAVRDEAVAVFITEDFGDHMHETLELLSTRALPVVTLIPTARGTTGATRERLRRQMVRAIGVAGFLGEED